jgi:adenine-specific DNA methylase
MWEGGKSVTQVTKGSIEDQIHDQEELLKLNNALAEVESVESDIEEMKYHHEEQMEMAEQTFSTMADKAKALIDAMNKDPEIALELSEPFIAAKLALMDDYMNTVYNYLMYPKSGEEKDTD